MQGSYEVNRHNKLDRWTVLAKAKSSAENHSKHQIIRKNYLLRIWLIKEGSSWIGILHVQRDRFNTQLTANTREPFGKTLDEQDEIFYTKMILFKISDDFLMIYFLP